MKTRLFAIPLMSLAVATPLWAASAPGTVYVDVPVESVEPIVRYVKVNRPRQNCWQDVAYERVPSGRPLKEAAPTIAGGLLGGLIGNQLTRGHNRDELTLIGAVAGAAIANGQAQRNSRYGANEVRAVNVQRCEVVNEEFTEQRIEGYNVTYRYDGALYTIRTSRDPGDRVRLRVSVTPIGM